MCENNCEKEVQDMPKDRASTPQHLLRRPWMQEARQIADQCWSENKAIDWDLRETVAKRIAAWMDTAAQNQRNTDYYRGLLVKCGEAIGDQAYIADDGSISDDVLCAKIPELVDAAFCHGSE